MLNRNDVSVWLSCRRPIGRVAFCVFQLAGVSLADRLFPVHTLSAGKLSMFVAATVVLFGVMGAVAAKRLLDVKWPQAWAASAAGPCALYVIFAVPSTPHSDVFRGVLFAIPIVAFSLLTVVYGIVTIALMFKASSQISKSA
jgi:uncharacterized membrane protein YhaH (DUF805 family)